MSEQTFGKIVVSGDAAELALAAEAYANQKMPVPVQNLQPRPYRAEFHTRREFLTAHAIIPGTNTVRPSEAGVARIQVPRSRASSWTGCPPGHFATHNSLPVSRSRARTISVFSSGDSVTITRSARTSGPE